VWRLERQEKGGNRKDHKEEHTGQEASHPKHWLCSTLHEILCENLVQSKRLVDYKEKNMEERATDASCDLRGKNLRICIWTSVCC